MFQLKDEKETIEILKNLLKFSNQDIAKIKIYLNLLLEANKKHNFIGKKTENYVWIRHVLDSAQLVKHISFKNTGSLADLGSGAGFPGIILAIFNKNNNFHVKLYDKSPVKCNFLQLVVNNIKIKAEIINCNIFHEKINSRYIVSRGFKKIDKMIQVSGCRSTCAWGSSLIVGPAGPDHSILIEQYVYRFSSNMEASTLERGAEVYA